MRSMRGVVSLVQEGRFRLAAEQGGTYLFVLSASCPVEPQDLPPLQRSGATVTVRYAAVDALEAGLVHDLRVHEGAQSRRGRSRRERRHGILDRVGGFLSDWSLPRQAVGQSHHDAAARSEASRRLRPRLEGADTVGTSICPYCAVGCGQLIYARRGEVIAVEGDPRSPVNQGTLCPKGAATFGLLTSPQRLDTVLHRRPGATQWEAVSLEWAMERIAVLAKRTRDETFVQRLPDGTPVNHTLGMASLGGATLDNEENYLIKKLFSGGLGMVSIENQARVCHSSSVPSLGASYGRGAATLPQWDLANADVVVVMGSNMAESHPIAFRFVLQAKARGATFIHVDPRFTRTSALSDIHAPIRTGSDIAFLGGIIRYILENDLWFRDYAMAYTNIATIIEDGFQTPDELDGVFSGWDEEGKRYTYDTWQYKGMAVPSSLSEHYVNTTESFNDSTKRLTEGPAPQDPTLTHPNCVYQIMKRHYARYTPEMVERVTGCPQDLFLKVCDALTRNSGPDRTGAFCYAVGWTHHSTGVQIIRAAAIIQGLLGNTGRPGGGILALRGHANIQGSTDIPTLYNMLPGYLPQPHAYKPHDTFDDYIAVEQTPTGWWSHFPDYAVSLLKAWYGDAATRENGWGFEWLPRIVGDHSQLPLTMAMRDGVVKGLFLMGQNPVVGSSNSHMVQRALGNLDWLVVRDFAETESASFWYRGHDIESGKTRPEDIKTEVFLMPAALAGEKAGTFTNTHRLVQWHDKVVDGPGASRSDLWFVYHLGRRLKELYADSDRPHDRAIAALTWDYPEEEGERREPSPEAVLKEINGYTWADKRQIADFKDLKNDGSTACGCWIYTGIYPDDGTNKARSRIPDAPDGPGSHLGWAFSWPENRRVMYNRASADPAGKPWSERKRLLWWDEGQARWTGFDTPDFQPAKRPDYEPDWATNPTGMDAISGHDPYIMIADGRASLFVPSGLKDGPLPTHYEPIESPVRNPLYPVQGNPSAKRWEHWDNPLHGPGDPQHPHALTTYRLTEHHCGGTPTRSVPTTAELQPEGFCEVPSELAATLGIRTLDWVVLFTARGEIETRALVTDRLRPFQIDGRTVHQIGMPWHFGWKGYATGDIANVLTALLGDPNTSMHENKSLTCGLRPGRLNRR